MQGKRLVVGLTGNIASGKSTVGNIFAEQGFHVIEADRIGWELLEDLSIAGKILAIFGNVEKDGAIDREKLGNVVFTDRAKLKILDDIIHPPLLKELKRKILESPHERVIANAALLFEWGIEDWFDKIVLVICDDEKKIDRLMKKGFTWEQAMERLQSQLPEPEKVLKSDFVIENNSTIAQLRVHTFKVINQIKKFTRT